MGRLTLLAALAWLVASFVSVSPLFAQEGEGTPEPYIARSMVNVNKLCDIMWAYETRCVVVSARYSDRPSTLSARDSVTGKSYGEENLKLLDGYMFFAFNMPMHWRIDDVVFTIDGQDFPAQLVQDPEYSADAFSLRALREGTHTGEVPKSWYRDGVIDAALTSVAVDWPDNSQMCFGERRENSRCVLVVVPAGQSDKIWISLVGNFGTYPRSADLEGSRIVAFNMIRLDHNNGVYLTVHGDSGDLSYRVKLTSAPGQADSLDLTSLLAS